ncbi:heterokaryon incompatibility protein-domain-containing protein [Stachybotrys elegans]|uniref:Heterokaryon incompatibility protein-domain-containing protein n=1 Tax=Stachybotrys elegans TaxID=80388 RepID=A0A8K0SHX0_9HYPO|nr:heterokaryon incompatibility protein-domain-containing protein [Stachybotrys elegans]
MPVQLSSGKSLSILQVDRWEPNSKKEQSMVITPDNLQQGQYIQVDGKRYMNHGTVPFELVATDQIDTRTEFGTTSQSRATRKLAKQWLSNCLKNHPKCAPSSSGEFPDRVLDVGLAGEDAIRLRLVKPFEEGQPRPPYATLSYCWGETTDSTVKLKTTNIDAFQQRIAVADLPKTMRHAVGLTRALGLRYLWIDSLCIIQDSVDDWRAQSALMGTIYQQSHVCIAATASENSDGGLFFERNPEDIRPVQLACHFPVDRTDNPRRTFTIVPQRPSFEFIDKAPLSKRGWVMQERLLSPRTLHCGETQLFWECRHMYADECHPNGLLATLDKLPGSYHHMISQLSRAGLTRQNAMTEATTLWLTLVKEYSERKLTRDEDILIAFSGIARQWRQVLPDEYLAGLWKSSIAEGLLWHFTFKIPAHIGSLPCPTWRAPSWSWASFKGPVSWSQQILPIPGGDGILVAKGQPIQYVGSDVTAVSSDDTGQLSSGSLTIEASLTSGYVSTGFKWPPELPYKPITPDAGWQFAIKEGSMARHGAFQTRYRDFRGVYHCDDSKSPMKQQMEDQGFLRVTYLPILTWVSVYTAKPGEEPTTALGVEGLMVERVDEAAPLPTYRRLGYFCMSSRLATHEECIRSIRDVKRKKGAELGQWLGLEAPTHVRLM